MTALLESLTALLEYLDRVLTPISYTLEMFMGAQVPMAPMLPMPLSQYLCINYVQKLDNTCTCMCIIIMLFSISTYSYSSILTYLHNLFLCM